MDVNINIPIGTKMKNTHVENNRKRGRPRTFDRKQVVDQAMIGYWEGGPQSLSINELCRRINVSKPSIYREFGGEDGLMVAVLSHYESLMMQQLMSLNTDEDSFSVILKNILNVMTRDRETPSGCLLVKMRLSPDRLGSKSQAKLLEIRSSFRHFYTLLAKKAIHRGEINCTSSVELVTHFLENQFALVLIQMSEGEEVTLIREQAVLAFSSLTKDHP